MTFFDGFKFTIGRALAEAVTGVVIIVATVGIIFTFLVIDDYLQQRKRARGRRRPR